MGERRSESRKKRQKQLARRVSIVAFIGIFAIMGSLFVYRYFAERKNQKASEATVEMLSEIDKIGAPAVESEFLELNEYSRPGTPLENVNGVVIHYVANPGTSAIANRNYFQGLKDTHTTKASSHFIVGLDGEIVQCIPSSEISYASNERNVDTVSIECCHPDESGKFNEETYQSMVNLTAWLCARFDLEREDVIRHFDVTGKLCPKYFVEHEDAWEQFKNDVETRKLEIKQERES